MTGPFFVEALGSGRDRARFCCGVPALDRCFQKQVTHDVRRPRDGMLLPLRSKRRRARLRDTTRRRPAFRWLICRQILRSGCRATRPFRWRGLDGWRWPRLSRAQSLGGGALLWDAVQRAARSEIAVFALVVDAKDAEAEGFYRHYGFVSFGSQPRQLVLPLTNVVIKKSDRPWHRRSST